MAPRLTPSSLYSDSTIMSPASSSCTTSQSYCSHSCSFLSASTRISPFIQLQRSSAQSGASNRLLSGLEEGLSSGLFPRNKSQLRNTVCATSPNCGEFLVRQRKKDEEGHLSNARGGTTDMVFSLQKFTSTFKSSRKEWRVAAARAGIDVSYQFEDTFGSLSLPITPEPVLFPRKTLNLKFAVLLMRSAYEAVDALDFIPMDKFQIRFWKLRQSEVEPYTLQCRPLRVKYGDLTDPLYFDFISFSQFATISNEMKTGEVVFQEKLGSDGELRTVRRDERIKDNAMLPAAFIDTAGKMLYTKLLEGFEGEMFDAPPPCNSPSDFSSVINGVKKLLRVFEDKGYVIKASVEPVQFSADKLGGKLRVKLDGSATQWGVRALASRRALLLTDFAALAVGAFLQASGFQASQKVRYTDTSTEQLWTIV